MASTEIVVRELAAGDLAEGHDLDAVGKLFDLVEVGRDEDDGDAVGGEPCGVSRS